LKYFFAVMSYILGLGVGFLCQANEDDLQVDFKASQARYRVGEPIQFEIHANRPFFLYLFSINTATQRGTMIMPNALARGNKYPANYHFLVPNASVTFSTEQAGIQKVVMVASRQKLEFDTQNYPYTGPFKVTQAKNIEDMLKGITLRPMGWLNPHQVVVQELAINVLTHIQTNNEASSQTPIRPPPISFVVTDKQHYTIGEHVHILYGADQAGWMQLYLEQTSGKRQLLKEHPINGQGFYRLKALAQKPKGSHQLIARFQSKGNNSGLSQMASTESKSLPWPDTSSSKEFAYRFWID